MDESTRLSVARKSTSSQIRLVNEVRWDGKDKRQPEAEEAKRRQRHNNSQSKMLSMNDAGTRNGE